MSDSIIAEFLEKYPDLKPCREDLLEAYRAIADCFAKGGILYLAGNGGSFADAMHIKGEICKRFAHPRPVTDPALRGKLQESEIGRKLADKLERGFPVVVLGESHSLRSAFENDVDPILHYAQELHAFAAHIKLGVFMGISTSGTAKNVIAAATLAKALGLTVIAFTGPAPGAPGLADLADIALKTPTGTNPSEVQELQLPLYHCLCLLIEAHFFD